MTFIATVDARGRITIPIELRRKLGSMRQMNVLIHEVDGGLLIEPARKTRKFGRKRRY